MTLEECYQALTLEDMLWWLRLGVQIDISPGGEQGLAIS